MIFWTEGSERVTEGKENTGAMAVYCPRDDRQLEQNCSSDPSTARSPHTSALASLSLLFASGSHTIIKIKPSINQHYNSRQKEKTENGQNMGGVNKDGTRTHTHTGAPPKSNRRIPGCYARADTESQYLCKITLGSLASQVWPFAS